ncbi:MAG TPA: HAD-IIA family hydrolase [Aggregatilineaceae bacterium]|nr:HAD-IIA family hydrolase [Aggregatilineaceae bacterium]
MSIHFSSLRAAILDMDGVLWRGDEVLPGIASFFTFVQQHAIAYALATNNSTKTVHAYVERLNSIGIPAGPQNVITSAVATAHYLRYHYPTGTPVYVIGGEGIHRALAEQGYPEDPERAELVVVGMDTALTYEKLKIATLRIRAGAHFIGTNGDLTFPLPEGLVPGNGSILAALQAATGTAPLVIGKPEKAMFEVALQRLGTTSEQTLMIGDRLETDIAGARRAGLSTALVLTGTTTAEQAEASDIHADGVFESLPDLCSAWAECLASGSVL